MSISLTGKRWVIREKDERLRQTLSESLSIDPIAAGVLILRGVRTREEGEVFLESSLGQLRNPLDIPSIKDAAERTITAIERMEKICIYGDYDVDGVTAASLMILVLKRLGADVSYCLPHRMKHGYGLHPDVVRQIRESGTDLLITVDNGISAVEEVALARALDMDVIITDHHEPPVNLPDTPFIVNPKIRTGLIQDSGTLNRMPFSELSGVGLAFALTVAVRAGLREKHQDQVINLPNLREYLDLVALGTIGDVVPLTDDNRILVRHGLLEIARTRNTGIRALMRAAGLNGSEITPGRVGFVLAPRINAAGRMGDAELALKLLVSSDEKEAEQAAHTLNEENRKRQETEKEILDAALEQAERERGASKVIVLHSEDWHPGVIGIVASRIAERFYRPTIMITRVNQKAVGSGRGIPGFSLYKALEACEGSLQGFGGHAMAAGLTLLWDRIPEFKEGINAYADRVLTEENLVPAIKVDELVDPDRITDRLLGELEKLKPFGMGNPEPTFLSKRVRIMSPRIVGEDHLRFNIPCKGAGIGVIGFHMKNLLGSLAGGAACDLLYHLRYNDYNGVRSIQAVLVDLRLSE